MKAATGYRLRRVINIRKSSEEHFRMYENKCE